MSLEAVLTENNTLLRELIALWKTGAAPAPAPVKTEPAAQSKAADEAKVETKTKVEAKAEPKVEPKTESTAATVTYDQIKPLIIKYNQTKGRDAATKLLAEFKVERGPDLKPEQFAPFHARIQELLA